MISAPQETFENSSFGERVTGLIDVGGSFLNSAIADLEDGCMNSLMRLSRSWTFRIRFSWHLCIRLWHIAAEDIRDDHTGIRFTHMELSSGRCAVNGEAAQVASERTMAAALARRLKGVHLVLHKSLHYSLLSVADFAWHFGNITYLSYVTFMSMCGNRHRRTRPCQIR